MPDAPNADAVVAAARALVHAHLFDRTGAFIALSEAVESYERRLRRWEELNKAAS